MGLRVCYPRTPQLVAFTVLISWVAGISRCPAQYESSQLLSLSRSGGQTGTSFDLRVATGNHLDEITALHFSNPAITAELKTIDPLPFTEQRQPDFGNFSVTIPQDVSPGRYEVRASGRRGISNPRAVLVSNLPNQILDHTSHDVVSPTPLSLGTLVHSKSTAAEIDFYALTLTKEQPIQIELFAQQLDSRMIGQLKLFDSAGHAVVWSRGADDVDPVFQTPDDLPAGDYVLAVHDFLYRGGDEYHYQLLVRPLDQARSLFGSEPAGTGQLPEIWATRSFSYRDRRGLPEAELSPQDVQRIEPPFEATRRFADGPGDTAFQFPVREGESVTIEVTSQRAGEPTDARATIQRVEPQETGVAKLHDIASADDWQGRGDGAINLHTTDPLVTIKAPTTADYRLTIRDLDIGTSLTKGQSYRIRVAPPEPGFDLVAYRMYPNKDMNQSRPFGSQLFRGGAELIRVFATRRDGFEGAIKLTCLGLPDGLNATEAIIAPNQFQTQITITAAEDAGEVVGPIQIIGRSEDGSIEQAAVPATIQWAKGAGRDFIQSRICSALWVASSAQDVDPLSITLGDASVAEAKRKSSLQLPIRLIRRDGGKAVCTARARDLPPGVTASDVTIPADKNDAEMEFKIADGAKPGTYSLWLQIETKIKVKPNPQHLERTQQYRARLQTLHDDPAQAANLDAIKTAITQADKRVETAKAAAKEKELTVFLPTSNATLRVVDP